MGFRNRKLTKTLAAFMASVFFITFVFTGSFQALAKSTADNSVIEEVRNKLRDKYVDQIPESVLNLPTIDEILAEINKTDPYTKYFSTKDFQEFVGSIDNKFSGIGVRIEFIPEGVHVNSVIDGSPALEAGLKQGDIIVMADGHPLAGLPDDMAVSYIKGPEGTTVNLQVKRGSETLTFDIVRRQISMPTVEGKILGNHIGYIQVVSFGEDTAQLFGKYVADYQAKKVDSYIIDLRYNGGGYLSTALEMAGYFIGYKRALITKSRVEGQYAYNAIYRGTTIDKPVIFLINNYSASASEVLSGAVKDYGKAYFLGMKSFGKGSVQETPVLSNNDYLKVTVAKFYSPNGNEINKVGIQPDMEVQDKVDSMRVAELILDSPKTLKSTSGYVKIETGGKTVIVKLSRIYDPLYWASYGQLVTNALKQGKIFFGNGKGWSIATRSQTSDIAKLYFPTYRLASKQTNVATGSAITVKFDAKIAKNSLTVKNTELIDAETGEKLGISFKGYKEKEVIVVPNKALEKGKNYLLVVHPTLIKADKKPLGTGMLNEIMTKKN